MTNKITSQLFVLLDEAGVPYEKLLNHPPSHTSAESQKVRKEASGLDTIGAKALVQRATNRDKSNRIIVFVIPGNARFDGKKAIAHLGDVKKIRFLTADEVFEATTLEIGCIPPFGSPLLENIEKLYFDKSLLDCKLVGFNAATHTSSVIMAPRDLITAAHPDDVFDFSTHVEE